VRSFSNRIARISPETGQVLGWIDLSGIIPVVELRSNDSVLNGIAWMRGASDFSSRGNSGQNYLRFA
jgi:glutamine cyclotransferase